MSARQVWDALEVDAPAAIAWVQPPDTHQIAVLLGAFDPPTNAHLEIVTSVARALRLAPVMCMTKVLLARGDDELFEPGDRAVVLEALAQRLGLALAFANRGTYLDVGRALAQQGYQATFVVGADKLDQLVDPAFYEHGPAGVEATFDELAFAVVPRLGINPASRLSARSVVLEAGEVFADPATAEISATEVRRMHRAGETVDAVVPPEVELALRGYTSAR